MSHGRNLTAQQRTRLLHALMDEYGGEEETWTAMRSFGRVTKVVTEIIDQHCEEYTQEVAYQRDRYAREMTEVRVALGGVAVFEGLVDSSPVAIMIDQLVRDHEELEARIDAALLLCASPAGQLASLHDEGATEALQEIARLLRGGSRIPDSPEGLEGSDD